MAATFIAPAIRKTQRGCHAAASSLLFSFSFLVFETCDFTEVLLRIVVVGFRRVFFISALTRCISGPCGLRWKRVPAPKVFLHSRRPTAMGAIAWQRTRRNGQCLLNVYKKELSPRSPAGSPANLGEGTSMPECPSRSCQTAALPGDGLRLPSWGGAFFPREGKEARS